MTDRDYVEIDEDTDGGSLDLITFTVEAWIMTKDAENTQNIINKRAAGDNYNNYKLLLKEDGGEVFPKGLIGLDGTNEVVQSPIPLVENMWYHLALTYDKDILKIYNQLK